MWLLCLLTWQQTQQTKLLDLHDMNNSSPARDGVPVQGIRQSLWYYLKQIIRLKVRLPQSLTYSIQLFCACPSHNKVLRLIDAANQIHTAYIRFECLWVQSCDYGLHKIGSKSARQNSSKLYLHAYKVSRIRHKLYFLRSNSYITKNMYVMQFYLGIIKYLLASQYQMCDGQL